MKPIIEYAGSKSVASTDRTPEYSLYLGSATCILVALSVGISQWLSDANWNIRFLAEQVVLGATVLTIIWIFIGLPYGGALYAFETRMHRRVRFKLVLCWVIPVSIVAGVFMKSAERFGGDYIPLTLASSPVILGFALSIATARPVISGPSPVPPVPPPAVAVARDSASGGTGGT